MVQQDLQTKVDVEKRVLRHLVRGLVIANLITIFVVLVTAHVEFGYGRMSSSRFDHYGMADWNKQEWIVYLNDRNASYAVSKVFWFVVFLLVQCFVIVGARDFVRAREKRLRSPEQ